MEDQQQQKKPDPNSGSESTEGLAAEKVILLEKAGRAKAQAVSDCVADVRRMINNPDYSDLVFLCQDGARVHASRLFLVARCPYFNRMLMNGMVESRLSEISLPLVSSTVLLSVLEFLYTGALVEHAPENWKRAFEIIGAAKFFLLDNLQLIVLEYLVSATTEVESDLTAAAKFLSVAVEFNNIFDSMDIIPRDLVSILNSRFLTPDAVQALTDKAFHYFLQKTRNDRADVRILSFDEYLRLRQVILWCACRILPSTAEEVDAFLPDVKASLSMLKNPLPLENGSTSVFHPHEALYQNDDLGRAVADFLPMVDLRRIHPELLIMVIEPLELISSAHMMEAMRFHALQRSRKASEKKAHEWHFRGSRNTDIYSVCRDGSVIEQIGLGIGFVRYTIAINRPYGIYEWDIVIEKVCDLFCEIGIHHESNKPHVEGSSLAEQPGGWALRMDHGGVCINRRGTHKVQQGDPGFVPYGKDCSQKLYGKDFGHKHTRVRVHLDMFERTCSFSVDKENFGVAWSNLPDGTYYPAVSLGGGCRGRARIQLVRGFEIL
ncbi:unnamed protein product [Calypogeia fissa]